MKALCILFACYVLALSCMPCSDAEVCVDEQRIGTVAAADHEHNAGEVDLCSPFCICSCCAAHIQLPESIRVITTHHDHNTPLSTLYKERLVLENTIKIWQPPRI